MKPTKQQIMSEVRDFLAGAINRVVELYRVGQFELATSACSEHDLAPFEAELSKIPDEELLGMIKLTRHNIEQTEFLNSDPNLGVEFQAIVEAVQNREDDNWDKLFHPK
jgi:hypothetical protein